MEVMMTILLCILLLPFLRVSGEENIARPEQEGNPPMEPISENSEAAPHYCEVSDSVISEGVKEYLESEGLREILLVDKSPFPDLFPLAKWLNPQTVWNNFQRLPPNICSLEEVKWFLRYCANRESIMDRVRHYWTQPHDSAIVAERRASLRNLIWLDKFENAVLIWCPSSPRNRCRHFCRGINATKFNHDGDLDLGKLERVLVKLVTKNGPLALTNLTLSQDLLTRIAAFEKGKDDVRDVKQRLERLEAQVKNISDILTSLHHNVTELQSERRKSPPSGRPRSYPTVDRHIRHYPSHLIRK